MAELPDTEGFAAAGENISPEAVARAISCGPRAEHHLEAIKRYIDSGYDHIILVQIGQAQDEFLGFFKRELAEPLRRSSAPDDARGRQRRPEPAQVT